MKCYNININKDQHQGSDYVELCSQDDLGSFQNKQQEFLAELAGALKIRIDEIKVVSIRAIYECEDRAT